tara:strand:- start:5163 stop:5912 length:750 start_codon:yes stop_codon:yes gene_type:complete
MNIVAKYTSNFTPISLKNMDGVKLMNRTDTKFAFSIKQLQKIFENILPYYDILEIDNKRMHSYKSLYFDTSDRKFYNDHHNKRVNRHKIRFREYVDSGLTYLEVKLKTNKGKTVKKRLKVDKISNNLTLEQQQYIDKVIGTTLNVIPIQWINFNRITLVHKTQKERLTIDINLDYYNSNDNGNLRKIIIAEVKQERMSRSSDFIRIAKEMSIFPMRISKYCFSSMCLDNTLKQNRFKEKKIFINKIIQE